VALDQARARRGAAAAIDTQKIDALARLMDDKQEAGNTNTRKDYIGSIIDAVGVDDQMARHFGTTADPVSRQVTSWLCRGRVSATWCAPAGFVKIG